MSSNTPNRLKADRPADWLDQMIETARERGDFDNLPGHGKPLDLPLESSAPSEFDLAFTMLSNAGYAPHWMELGKEADRLEARLTDLRKRASAEIAELQTELRFHTESEQANVGRRSWWRRIWRGEAPRSAAATRRITPNAIERRRQELKRQHQELVEKLDAKVATYHAAMPRELWHVERDRTAPEAWETIFDSACPPHVSANPEKIQSLPPLTDGTN